MDGTIAEGEDPWPAVLDLAGQLYRAANAVARDQSAAVSRLRAELVTGHRRLALLLLPALHTDLTVALADILITYALSHRDALLVRQLFARLPRHEAVSVVPPAVWAQLGRTDDEDAYRRLAELLDYLGLEDALRELVAQALASDDPAVREIGEELAE